jgi:Peptidase family M23
MQRLVVATLVAGLSLVAPAWGGEDWTWPVRGTLVTMYENNNARPYAGGMHRGIDIAADAGTAVVAARSGTVTYAGALGSSGNVVAVRDGRYAVSYLHLGAVSVSRGDRVAKGARVGDVGTTGRRSVPEPHLHFGVRLARVDDHYVDPLSLLPAVGRGASAPAVPVAVPVGPLPRTEPVRIRHPVAAPSAPRLRVAAPDRGRPLVLGGLVLLALVLFGGVLVRANTAVNARATAVLRALRDARAVIRRTQPDH